ncbi:MAG: RNA methyltransferase [Bacilli bacterium]|jgi:NOL1/NOP2/sun family putative RNA methylase|nr:RNA methyltransferase [Bacilli bacterium]
MKDIFKSHLKKYLSDKTISDLVESFSKPRLHGLLRNENKISHEKLLKYFPSLIKHPLINNGYTYDPNLISPGKHWLFDAGCYYLQDLSAMLVASLLPIEKDDIVLDMCAAPGGKTVQTSLKLSKSGLILANDISKKRANILVSNIERMGLGNVIVANEDALNICKKYPNMFTKILLDAPCSGSGMFKKDDKMIEDWHINKVLSAAKLQKELIVAAYDALAPGGLLLYSTCSFSYEENEEVIFELKKERDIILVNIANHVSFYRDDKLKEAIHLFPHLYEGDGHFICLIKKPGELKTSTIPKKKLSLLNHNESTFYKLEDQTGIYGINIPFDTKDLFILRYGVKLFDKQNKQVIPHHHLTHFLDASNSITLNDEELKIYLSGNVIKKDNIKDGFHIVSYDGINLGLIKASRGMLKNHYPKGLRR